MLVTGASGFTGKYVVASLKERALEIRGLSSAECDIRDAAALREIVRQARPNFVIHLAGTPNLPDAEAETAFSINVHGTVNLLQACEALPDRPRKILIASSSFVYGDTGTTAASEEAPLAPAGAYGRSKREMEIVAERWFSRLPIIIARPFNYTGAGHGERFLMPKLVRLFREKGADASFVDPNAVRDYSDVRWVASVYADLLQSSVTSAVINVCSGVGTPLPALIEMLERLTGHSVARKPVRHDDSAGTAMVGSPARLLKLLGKRSPYSLAETLRWMLD